MISYENTTLMKKVSPLLFLSLRALIDYNLILLFKYLAVIFVVLPDQDDDMESDGNPGEISLLMYNYYFCLYCFYVL